MPAREATVEELPPPAPAPSATAAQPVAPPAMLLRVGRSDRIEWKSILRIVVPLAAAVGLLSAGHSGLWLILLPAGIAFTVHIYRSRQPVPLRVSQGAKLGLFTGVLSVVFLGFFLAAKAGFTPDQYRRDVEQTIAALKAQETRNPNPLLEPLIQSLSDGTKGLVLNGVLEIVSAMLFFPLLGGISGAVAAALMKPKIR